MSCGCCLLPESSAVASPEESQARACNPEIRPLFLRIHARRVGKMLGEGEALNGPGCSNPPSFREPRPEIGRKVRGSK